LFLNQVFYLFKSLLASYQSSARSDCPSLHELSQSQASRRCDSSACALSLAFTLDMQTRRLRRPPCAVVAFAVLLQRREMWKHLKAIRDKCYNEVTFAFNWISSLSSCARRRRRRAYNVHYVKCTLTRPRQLELIAPVHKGSWRKWDSGPSASLDCVLRTLVFCPPPKVQTKLN
jgi:hypothetical protein